MSDSYANRENETNDEARDRQQEARDAMEQAIEALCAMSLTAAVIEKDRARALKRVKRLRKMQESTKFITFRRPQLLEADEGDQ